MREIESEKTSHALYAARAVGARATPGGWSMMLRVRLAAACVVAAVTVMAPKSSVAQQPAAVTSIHHATAAQFRDWLRAVPVDTGAPSSRRAAITGGVIGALLGGLGTAAVVLNATAYHCVTSGPPCPRKNFVFLHTVTISAGALAGGAGGAAIGRWVSRKL